MVSLSAIGRKRKKKDACRCLVLPVSSGAMGVNMLLNDYGKQISHPHMWLEDNIVFVNLGRTSNANQSLV